MRYRPDRVRQARLKAGLTQEQLADRLDMRLKRNKPMRAQNVHRWETPGKNEPSGEMLVALAAETGYPVEHFFEEDDEEELALDRELLATLKRWREGAARPDGVRS